MNELACIGGKFHGEKVWCALLPSETIYMGDQKYHLVGVNINPGDTAPAFSVYIESNVLASMKDDPSWILEEEYEYNEST